MQQRITKRFLDTVESDPSKDQFYFDPQLAGFGVKVTRTGRKNFIVNARMKGRHPKRVTIGQYPDWKVVDARDRALALLKMLRDGIDPVKEKREAQKTVLRKEAHARALQVSLEDVVNQFIQARQLKPKTQYDYLNTFKNCFADWADQPIRSITRKDVEARFLHIQQHNRRSEKETGKAQARKAMSFLSAVMNFAAAEEIEGERLIQDNPVRVLADKKMNPLLKTRTRIVPLDDLWKIVRTFEWLPNQTAGDLMTILLYTGLRLNEAAKLQWNNIDFKHHYFTVTDTKNGLDHFVPMASDVEYILKERKRQRVDQCNWVFPSRIGNGPVVDIRKSVLKASQVSGILFTCHDLRRTFATIADCCGLDHMTIKRVLNHKHRDITQQYIQKKVDDLRTPMNEIQSFLQNSLIHDEEKTWLIDNLGQDFVDRVYSQD